MLSKKLNGLKIIFGAVVWLFAAQFSANAQANFSETLVLDLPNGSAISFQPETIATQAVNSITTFSFANLKQQAVKTPEKRVHRFLYDEENNVLFGYDLTFETNPKTKQLKISVVPMASEDAQKLREQFFPNVQTRRKVRLLTIPASAAPQMMANGDTVSLDLLVSTQLGLKITDKLRFFAGNRDLPTMPVRDFNLSNIELAVKGAKLLVNGEAIAENASTRRFSGSLLWFHFPEKGLFVFSLTPKEGYDFQKIGTVEDKKIRFNLDGDSYEWNSSEKIVPLDGAWSLWVLQLPETDPYGISFTPETQEKKPSSWLSPLLSIRDFVVRLVPFVQKEDLPDLSNGFNFNFLSKPFPNKFNAEKTTAENPTPLPKNNFQRPRLRVGGTNDLETLIPK